MVLYGHIEMVGRRREILGQTQTTSLSEELPSGHTGIHRRSDNGDPPSFPISYLEVCAVTQLTGCSHPGWHVPGSAEYVLPRRFRSVSIRSLVSRPPLRLSLGYLAGLSIFSPSTTCTRLVVEEPDALLDKRDAQLLRRLEHLRVVLAPARRRDVLGPGAPRSVDVIRERELLD